MIDLNTVDRTDTRSANEQGNYEGMTGYEQAVWDEIRRRDPEYEAGQRDYSGPSGKIGSEEWLAKLHPVPGGGGGYYDQSNNRLYKQDHVGGWIESQPGSDRKNQGAVKVYDADGNFVQDANFQKDNNVLNDAAKMFAVFISAGTLGPALLAGEAAAGAAGAGAAGAAGGGAAAGGLAGGTAAAGAGAAGGSLAGSIASGLGLGPQWAALSAVQKAAVLGALQGGATGGLSGGGIKGVLKGALTGGLTGGAGAWAAPAIASATGLAPWASKALASAGIGGLSSGLQGGNALRGAISSGVGSLVGSGLTNAGANSYFSSVGGKVAGGLAGGLVGGSNGSSGGSTSPVAGQTSAGVGYTPTYGAGLSAGPVSWNRGLSAGEAGNAAWTKAVGAPFQQEAQQQALVDRFKDDPEFLEKLRA